MANRGISVHGTKPIIAPEQAVDGAGASPEAAAAKMKPRFDAVKRTDSPNTERRRHRGNYTPAPDHRVPVAHKQVPREANYVEPSR